MSSNRNRAQGWQHAKLDGHANESDFGKLLGHDSQLVSEIQKRFLKSTPQGSPEIEVDGNKQVESIFGELTISKVDLSLKWKSGERLNISLKKSTSGQVWLVSVPRFIAAIEHHSSQTIEPDVRTGISLFIGGTNLSNYENLFDRAIDADKAMKKEYLHQEIYQKRLLGKSLEANYPGVWSSTLNFFRNNLALITRLCFSQGLAKSEKNSAEIIVYNREKAGNQIFSISTIIENLIKQKDLNSIGMGPRNGGSTIQLPTGFLQMHHPQGENLMQFHHQYKKIVNI